MYFLQIHKVGYIWRGIAEELGEIVLDRANQIYQTMKRLFYILTISLTFISYSFSQHTEHMVGPLKNTYNSISSDLMTNRIINAANEYRQYAPVPRIAQFDYSFAKDIDEYKKLNGFGILYIASLNQDSTEYPIEKVYFKHNGGVIELQLIYKKAVPVTDNLIKDVFGNHRVDFYYLMPYVVTQISGQLIIDWKKNRKEFVISEFPSGSSLDYITDNKLLVPDTKKDIQKIDLDIFAQREFQIKIYW